MIDDAIINKVDNVKFLGVTINEYLDWSTHISVISKSVARSVGILSKLKFILPSNILKLIYNSLILPHLSYCNHIWGNTFKSHLKQLHILQKKSVRIITKSSFYSASAPLFKSLLILPIYDLVTLNTLYSCFLSTPNCFQRNIVICLFWIQIFIRIQPVKNIIFICPKYDWHCHWTHCHMLG